MNDLTTRHAVTVAGNEAASQWMVFVHGLGTDQTVWKGVAEAFQDDYRQLFFDNAGAGRSDSKAFIQSQYLDLHGYARDLNAICAAYDVQDACLVGHSMGAMACVLAAIDAPERFRKLVLIGASPRYVNDGDYRGGMTSRQLDDIYQAVNTEYSEWITNFAAAAMGQSKAYLLSSFVDSLRSIPKAQLLTVLCSIFQSDHRADLEHLDKPTLIIQSAEDFAVPLDVARFLRDHIPRSRMEVIAAIGHLPHITAPEEVIAAMRPFV